MLPYTKEQLFDLVADIERYPEFLPWCLAARIRKREGDTITADLLIGFKMVRERFTSKVVLKRPDIIDVSYAEGPFKYLDNVWRFEPVNDNQSIVHFCIDYEFKSRLLGALMGSMFDRAFRMFSEAFEKRADVIYGA